MPRQQAAPRGKGSLKVNKHIMGRLARYIFKMYRHPFDHCFSMYSGKCALFFAGNHVHAEFDR